MPAIILDDISFSYSSSPLLDHVSLRVDDGERACLIGPNGCGKTTLLRIVTGRLLPDRGTVTCGCDAGPRLIPDTEGSGGSVGEYLDASLRPLRVLFTRFEEITARISEGGGDRLAREYDRLLAQMTARDAWSLDARVDETLAGLGLSELTGPGRGRSLGSLSPGQRGRLRLAATLLVRPETLILDEPTNHLDAGAVGFLTRVINHWRGPVLMASHDRAFIEDTATVTYDMDIDVWRALARAEGADECTGLHRCAGNYSDYLEEKRRARARHSELHAAQQAEKRGLREHRQAGARIARGGVRLARAEGMAKKYFADRAAATATRRTRNDDRRLEDLSRQEVRKPRGYELSFPMNPVPVRPGSALSARRVAVRRRLASTSFDLARGEHLLVTGSNGAGKTTLLSWIATGKSPAGAQASGTLACDRPIGFVPQHLPRAGDPGFAEEIWLRGVGELGRGILHPSMWTVPVPELSAGNQRRAQLAMALAGCPAVLVIDEPTNYLDLDTMEALEEALHRWTGTLVVASHDRWLIGHWHGHGLHLEPA